VRDVVNSAIDIFGEKLQLRYTNENSKPLESQLLDLDSNKARVELKWIPTWSQKEALRATFIWWEKVLENPFAAAEVCAIDINTLIDSKS
jgi:nucleoside-diphosphate-sugar epimerase